MIEQHRLAVLDDHQLFAETLTLALSQQGYDTRLFAIPNRPSGAGDLVAEMTGFKPSVALIDLDLGPFGNGLRVIRPLVAAGIAVMVITAAPRSRWGECLVHGASRVVAKTTALHEILDTVHRLSIGQQVLAPGEFEELVSQWESASGMTASLRRRLATLTVREQEVLAQLMVGRTVRDIARESVVSEATVRTQIRSILGKLEVSSQLAAVVVATQAGWHLERGSGFDQG